MPNQQTDKPAKKKRLKLPPLNAIVSMGGELGGPLELELCDDWILEEWGRERIMVIEDLEVAKRLYRRWHRREDFSPYVSPYEHARQGAD